MSVATYHGVVRGRTVLLDDAAPLVDGTEVFVTPVEARRGSAAALLAAINAEPHVSSEDVDEFERAIAQGRRPLSRIAPFTDESGEESRTR
jgi:hypothetical protein